MLSSVLSIAVCLSISSRPLIRPVTAGANFPRAQVSTIPSVVLTWIPFSCKFQSVLMQCLWFLNPRSNFVKANSSPSKSFANAASNCGLSLCALETVSLKTATHQAFFNSLTWASIEISLFTLCLAYPMDFYPNLCLESYFCLMNFLPISMSRNYWLLWKNLFW